MDDIRESVDLYGVLVSGFEFSALQVNKASEAHINFDLRSVVVFISCWRNYHGFAFPTVNTLA